MELSDYIRTLRKNWVIILVLTVVGLGASGGYSLSRTSIYESTSTVFVSTQAGSTAAELQQGSSFTQARINTYVGLITTPVVLNPVIAELGVAESADRLASQIKASAALNSTLITITVSDSDASQAAQIANAVASSLAEVVPRLEPAAKADRARSV